MSVLRTPVVGIGLTGPGRPLSPLECRSWVSDRHIGRLGHLTGRGPRAIMIGYGATDAQLVFRLPDDKPVAHYARGQQISLSVTAASADRSVTDVQVRGVGYVPDDHRDLADTVDLPEQWPTGIAPHHLSRPGRGRGIHPSALFGELGYGSGVAWPT